MLREQLGERGPGAQRGEHRDRLGTEPEPPEVPLTRGAQQDPASAEPPHGIREPRRGQVLAHARVDRRADVDVDARQHREPDPLLDDVRTVVDGERARDPRGISPISSSRIVPLPA